MLAWLGGASSLSVGMPSSRYATWACSGRAFGPRGLRVSWAGGDALLVVTSIVVGGRGVGGRRVWLMAESCCAGFLVSVVLCPGRVASCGWASG